MKYDEPGIYELTYKATDECGNESYATRVVTVEAEPSQYPYELATIGAFSPPGTYTPGDWVSIPNNLVSILEAPKNEIEYGGLIITNLVVNGVSYDEISCEVRLYDENGVTVIEGGQLAEIPGYLSIYFNRQNLTVDSAGVLVDGEYISFSWESATITMEGAE